MSGTDTAASGAAARALSRTRSRSRNVGLRNAKASAFSGGVCGRPAEGVAPALPVDQRVVLDGGEHAQPGIDAAQQVPQVVVLPEERVESAVHRQVGAVVGNVSVQPPTRPPR